MKCKLINDCELLNPYVSKYMHSQQNILFSLDYNVSRTYSTIINNVIVPTLSTKILAALLSEAKALSIRGCLLVLPCSIVNSNQAHKKKKKKNLGKVRQKMNNESKRTDICKFHAIINRNYTPVLTNLTQIIHCVMNISIINKMVRGIWEIKHPQISFQP